MLKDITIGQYFPGDSIIHKLDPRGKILLTLALIVLVFLATDLAAYALLAVFLFSAAGLAQLSRRRLLRSVRPLWPILLITFLVHTFNGQGEILFSLFIFKAGSDGFLLGLTMTIRIIFLILFSSLITMTTSPLELTDGLERLLWPFKKIGLPAHELAMMMTIALRFVPTLIQETERIMTAQTARGAEFSSGSLSKRVKNLLSLVVPLFISAFRRADELALAMEARCYRGGEGRTRMNELAMGARDVCAALVVGVLIIAVCYIKWCF